jgi:hypothetical protein
VCSERQAPAFIVRGARYLKQEQTEPWLGEGGRERRRRRLTMLILAGIAVSHRAYGHTRAGTIRIDRAQARFAARRRENEGN